MYSKTMCGVQVLVYCDDDVVVVVMILRNKHTMFNFNQIEIHFFTGEENK